MDFISYFVLNKMRAKRKIQWIHFDITQIGFNPKFAAKFYNKFEKVCVVSKKARDKLLNSENSLCYYLGLLLKEGVF
jgi:hypothetical protein